MGLEYWQFFWLSIVKVKSPNEETAIFEAGDLHNSKHIKLGLDVPHTFKYVAHGDGIITIGL